MEIPQEIYANVLESFKQHKAFGGESESVEDYYKNELLPIVGRSEARTDISALDPPNKRTEKSVTTSLKEEENSPSLSGQEEILTPNTEKGKNHGHLLKSTSSTEYKVHELCTRSLELSKEEYRVLKESIERNGQIVPLILLKGTEEVLAGRHRLRACQELGITPQVTYYQGPDDPESLAEFVLDENMARRQSSYGQRVVTASDYANYPLGRRKEVTDFSVFTSLKKASSVCRVSVGDVNRYRSWPESLQEKVRSAEMSYGAARRYHEGMKEIESPPVETEPPREPESPPVQVPSSRPPMKYDDEWAKQLEPLGEMEDEDEEMPVSPPEVEKPNPSVFSLTIGELFLEWRKQKEH